MRTATLQSAWLAHLFAIFLFYYLIMKKRKSSIKKLWNWKINFIRNVSIYKEKFSHEEITFKPKFSITKNITFSSHQKVANNLAKAFKRLKTLKF